MALDKFLEDKLVREHWYPQRLAEFLSDEIESVTEEDAFELIRDRYSLTEDPGRRSFDYCLRCNPYLNGSHGREGTEAIAKHKIETHPIAEQFITGWEGLCEDCARKFPFPERLEPLPGHEDHDLFDTNSDEIEHTCVDFSWQKTSLVTEDGGYDWVECEECGIQAKRHGLNNIEVIGYE